MSHLGSVRATRYRVVDDGGQGQQGQPVGKWVDLKVRYLVYSWWLYLNPSVNHVHRLSLCKLPLNGGCTRGSTSDAPKCAVQSWHRHKAWSWKEAGGFNHQQYWQILTICLDTSRNRELVNGWLKCVESFMKQSGFSMVAGMLVWGRKLENKGVWWRIVLALTSWKSQKCL